MEDESIHIVMEYAEKGDLYKVRMNIEWQTDSFWKSKEQDENIFLKKIYGIFHIKYAWQLSIYIRRISYIEI